MANQEAARLAEASDNSGTQDREPEKKAKVLRVRVVEDGHPTVNVKVPTTRPLRSGWNDRHGQRLRDTAPGHQQQGLEPPGTPGSPGGVEADPGLVGQACNPLGPQHPGELTEHAWQAPGRHHRHALRDHLASGDLGAVDGHDRHYHHVGVGQHLGGLVGLERHGPQGGGEGISAVPEPP